MIAKKKRNRKKNAIEEKAKKLTKGVIKTKKQKETGFIVLQQNYQRSPPKKRGPILTKCHKEKNTTRLQ